jgi:hypothetical protein
MGPGSPLPIVMSLPFQAILPMGVTTAAVPAPKASLTTPLSPRLHNLVDRDPPFFHGQTVFARHLQNGVAGHARQDRAAQGRGHELPPTTKRMFMAPISSM